MEVVIPTNKIVEEIKLNAYINERTIYLNDDTISEETEFIVNRMFEKIVERDQKSGIKPKDAEPIVLKISTYGGDVFATLSIISTIEMLKDMGYCIIGKAYGKVMSGGFKIFIACSERICQRHTRFLYHQVQSYEFGNTSVEQSKRKLNDLEELWRRCQDIILKYTNITQEKLDDITKHDLDVSLWAEEAINLGCVDKII
jgi:ATP-dependent protease ClpP protease subunit